MIPVLLLAVPHASACILPCAAGSLHVCSHASYTQVMSTCWQHVAGCHMQGGVHANVGILTRAETLAAAGVLLPDAPAPVGAMPSLQIQHRATHVTCKRGVGNRQHGGQAGLVKHAARRAAHRQQTG